MSDYAKWVAEYEEAARRCASVAYDYREKVKAANTLTDKHELREKAEYYENLCKEKLHEAKILRERM